MPSDLPLLLPGFHACYLHISLPLTDCRTLESKSPCDSPSAQTADGTAHVAYCGSNMRKRMQTKARVVIGSDACPHAEGQTARLTDVTVYPGSGPCAGAGGAGCVVGGFRAVDKAFPSNHQAPTLQSKVSLMRRSRCRRRKGRSGSGASWENPPEQDAVQNPGGEGNDPPALAAHTAS